MVLDENLFGGKEPIMIREFRDEESLAEMQALFDNASIPYSIYDSESRFDVTFSYDKSRRTFKLFVPADFAEKAKKICEEEEAAIIARLPKDYYLFEFTNDELKSVIIQSFEWSPLDVSLAKIILQQRGENPENEELVREEEKALSAFDAPERTSATSIYLGYLFSILGGLFGIIFVIYILTSKKTTHEGIKISRFDDWSKKHAYYMIAIIVLVNVIALIYNIQAGSL